MSEVTTTLVVDFKGAEDDEAISAEIDDREDGFNKGKTRFVPGDSPAFLVFLSEGIQITDITPSMGSIGNLGSGSMLREEEIQFAKTNEATARVPIASINQVEWVGNSLGTLSFDGKQLTAQSSGVAVARIKYNASYRAFRLTNIRTNPLGDGSNFSVIVYIEGDTAISNTSGVAV